MMKKKLVAIRMTEAEIKRLKAAAKRAGRGWTTYVREVALAHAARTTKK